jgi:hypothetical protein
VGIVVAYISKKRMSADVPDVNISVANMCELESVAEGDERQKVRP